nr:MAG TPA: hypothetical protein [Caudoviricetes sp.]DAT94443.1 MAG TPA: hypothetical protein [Caudoviricetes sp.]
MSSPAGWIAEKRGKAMELNIPWDGASLEEKKALKR